MISNTVDNKSTDMNGQILWHEKSGLMLINSTIQERTCTVIIVLPF